MNVQQDARPYLAQTTWIFALNVVTPLLTHYLKESIEVLLIFATKTPRR